MHKALLLPAELFYGCSGSLLFLLGFFMLHSINPLLPWLDIAGVTVFAASGALAAAKARQTFVTFCFFALVTGTGGGTVRDLLIGTPVFWMQTSWPAAVCFTVAGAVWFAPKAWWPERSMDWFDAMGLAAYAVYGAAKAIHLGIPPLPAMVMGVVTACLGGIIRDVIGGVPSILLRPELYVTAAAFSSGLFILLHLAGLPGGWSEIIAALAGFTLRGIAISRGLGLPVYGGAKSLVDEDFERR